MGSLLWKSFNLDAKDGAHIVLKSKGTLERTVLLLDTWGDEGTVLYILKLEFRWGYHFDYQK